MKRLVSRKSLKPLAGLLVGAAVLAGCAAAGDVSNPLERRLTWIDHISGGDIRRDCAAGEGVGRYRFVEYRNRAEQVRLYDLTPAVEGGTGSGAAMLRSHVLKARIDPTNWAIFSDPLKPWRGEVVESRLSGETAEAIRADARDGGLGDPPPVGRTLASRSFFWLVSACLEGQDFAFQVWEWPSEGYRDRAFADLLHEADATGVALNAPPEEEERILNPVNPRAGAMQSSADVYEHYDLTVEAEGVAIGRSYPERSQGPATD